MAVHRFASPVTHRPGGPVDKPVDAIAQRLHATPDQILLAWAKAKGAVVVTYVPIPLIVSPGSDNTPLICLDRAQRSRDWRVT
jgi:hypothetical protein